MSPLICAWINCWVNNRETGDLRRHRAHYDVTAMAKLTETCPLAAWCSIILPFQTGMGATLLNYMCLCVLGVGGGVLLQSLQRCSSVGCNRVSPAAFQCVSTKFFQWCSSVPYKFPLGRPVVSQCTLGKPVAFQWHSGEHCTSQFKLSQSKGTESSLGHEIACRLFGAKLKAVEILTYTGKFGPINN